MWDEKGKVYSMGAFPGAQGIPTFQYDRAVVGAQPSHHVTGAFTVPQGRTLVSLADLHVDQQASLSLLSGTRMEVGSGDRIIVHGAMTATGTVFTARDPVNGWGGLRFESGSGGSLRSSTIDRVAGWGNASITVTNASPLLGELQINNNLSPFGPGNYVAGLRITGPAANVVVEGIRIERMTNGAVVIDDRAVVRMRGNEFVRNTGPYLSNPGYTVLMGYITDAFLMPIAPVGGTVGNRIQDNTGDGISASSSANPVLGRYYYPSSSYDNDGFNFVDGNTRTGVVVRSNASLEAGGGGGIGKERNSFADNVMYDASVSGTGARLVSDCNWWGTASPPFNFVTSNGGTVANNSWLVEDPEINPSAQCTSGSLGGSPPVSNTRAEEDSPSKRLRTADTLRGRARLDVLIDIVAESPHSPEASAAITASALLARRPDAPPGAASFVESIAAETDHPARRAALLAAAGLRYRAGDIAGALDAAHEVLDEVGDLVHPDAVAAQFSVVYALVASGRVDEAAWEYSRLADAVPGSPEVALAGVHLGLSEPVGESERLRIAPQGAIEVQPADLPFEVGVPRPNPATDRVTLALSFIEDAEVQATVHDMAGRVVLQALVDGQTVSLDVSGLPAGIYTVHVTETGPAAQPPVSRLITIVR